MLIKFLRRCFLEGRFSVGCKLGLIFSVAIAFIIIFNGVLRVNAGQIEQVNQLREHTQQTISLLSQVLSLVKDAETGQRGFLLTGKEEYLEPYRASVQTISEYLRKLEMLCVGEPEQQERLQRVDTLINGPDGKFAELAETIALSRNGRHERAIALVNSDKGKELMQSILHEINMMVGEEGDFLETRDLFVTHMVQRSKDIMTYGMIIGILVLVCFACIITQNITRPLNQLSINAKQISAGNFNHVVADPLRKDEIGVLDRSFGEMAQALKARTEELEEARLAAERANEDKSLFLATVSHEIRTPMSGVVGFAEILLDSDLNENDRECVELIHGASESSMNMIDEILGFSKSEKGDLIFDAFPFDLVASIEEVAKLLRYTPQLKAQGLALTTTYNCDRCEVIGDQQKMKQVLINLMNNAIKFTQKGGVHVELHADRVEGGFFSILIVVNDTGLGIPADQIESIFERYQQIDTGKTPTCGGVGLGLYITRNLIRGMGGSLDVTSEEGIGSTFTIRLKLPANDPQGNSIA